MNQKKCIAYSPYIIGIMWGNFISNFICKKIKKKLKMELILCNRYI
jgi:hypothetical protein